MRYAHIIHYFNSAPWAILPEKLQAILDLIELRAAGLTLTDAEIEARIGPQERTASSSPSSIAVIPVFGTIAHRANTLRRASGGTSVEDTRNEFRTALRDPNVAAIVLDIDSPGGSTSGIEEFADEIHAARKEKRIIASVNSLAASAAYWLAVSAHEIAITPSGHTGSIGVLGVSMDFSEKAKAEGVSVTIVSAGKFKSEASEFSPMTAEAMAHLQHLVDDRYDAFVRAVARGRGKAQKAVRDGFGEGRVVTARDALSMGMVDSIETMDEVISRTASRARRASQIAASTSWEFGLLGDDGVFDLAVMGKAADEMLAEERRGFAAQAILAPKAKWAALDDVKVWAKEKGYRSDHVEELESSWRFEQRDPQDFQSLRTVCVDPGWDTPINSDACRALMVGGRLKPGVSADIQDPNLEAVDETLLLGIVPKDVSDKIAEEGAAWSTPALKDFSDKPWPELTDAEKRRIVMHAAWAPKMPPDNFSDIKLFHHRPADGAVVPNGVRNALARLSQTQGLGDDRPRVEAHLQRHMDAIRERRQSALANPTLDPRRVELELMELG